MLVSSEELLTDLRRLEESATGVSLKWRNKVLVEIEGRDGMGDVTFLYRMDGSGTVWAGFERVQSADAVRAELVAVFE